MRGIFLEVVNRSVTAGWLVLAVAVLRLFLKRAPKWIGVLLWGMVALRLLCPVSIESRFSLVPQGQARVQWTLTEAGRNEEALSRGNALGAAAGEAQEAVAGSGLAGGGEFSLENRSGVFPLSRGKQDIVSILSIIWILGALSMGLYALFSYLRLRKLVSTAVVMRDNIFRSERVVSPFVLGLGRPRIYVPFQMEGKNLAHVVMHEQVHVLRRDHWWKPLGFLLLSVYWFHPLMWLAYVLFCRDMELACDEKAIMGLDDGQRADYSQALLDCSISRKGIAACPLAFGETGVKTRVKSILRYRKPAFWIVALALTACAVVAVCFLTDPARDSDHGDTLARNLSAEDEAGYQEDDPWAAFGAGMSEDTLPLKFSLSQIFKSWDTTLTLYPDGSFQGVHFHDEDTVAEEYPRGTRYYCEFTGEFDEITKVNEYTYSLHLAELHYKTDVEGEWIEDWTRYIGTEAVGLAKGETFLFYLPDTPMEELDETYGSKPPNYFPWTMGLIEKLGCYGIYNAQTEHSFFTSAPTIERE